MFQIPGPDSDAHFDDLFSDDSHDTGPDEPDSPTVLLDKKTRRRFLDLGLVSYKFRATKNQQLNVLDEGWTIYPVTVHRVFNHKLYRTSSLLTVYKHFGRF